MSLSAHALVFPKSWRCFKRMFLDGRKPGSVAWDLAAGGSWGSQTRANPVGDDIGCQDAGCIFLVPNSQVNDS